MSTPPLHARSTMDEQILRAVYAANEYRLPDDMAGWAVLDAGGHAGYFARACVERGARVLSYEPAPDNCRLWAMNLAHFGGRARLVQAAVGHAFGHADLLAWCGDPACLTTVGRAGEGGALLVARVPAVTLDHACLEAMAFAGKDELDLVKLDVEGAEYATLLEARVPRVRRLTAELHDFGRHPAGARPLSELADDVRRHLAGLGFDEVEYRDAATGDGYWYRIYRGERR